MIQPFGVEPNGSSTKWRFLYAYICVCIYIYRDVYICIDVYVFIYGHPP